MLEQYSMCVVTNYDQDVYVPWLVCKDSNKYDEPGCATSTGVDDSAMNTCMESDSALIDQYLEIDSPIGGTPTVYVDGSNVRTTYSAISRALCKSDPTMAACSSLQLSEEEEEEVPKCTYNRDGEIVA